MRHALRSSAWLLVGAFALVGTPVVHARAPEFGKDSSISHDGSRLLKWSAESDAVGFQVQHATDESFEGARVFYEGTMPSAHVSGLRDGEHFFRVRSRDDSGAWSEWSEPVQMTVAHHSMAVVWPLFGLGATVFFCTFGFIVFQLRASEGES